MWSGVTAKVQGGGQLQYVQPGPHGSSISRVRISGTALEDACGLCHPRDSRWHVRLCHGVIARWDIQGYGDAELHKNVPLSERSHERFFLALRSDTSFLKKCMVADYSLLEDSTLDDCLREVASMCSLYRHGEMTPQLSVLYLQKRWQCPSTVQYCKRSTSATTSWCCSSSTSYCWLPFHFENQAVLSLQVGCDD
ncbi:hypothetical protein SELMODRAFT_413450 [Selaginella moellendorffii]|uniref:Uncharacterized protein n=1 Tax=Selaginella moellendorffii TaxID=88036 RepID=D8RPH9_SELML|nr:hypothetical protein SELMODRAFT_413450 [Selaginella moellendorffii]